MSVIVNTSRPRVIINNSATVGVGFLTLAEAARDEAQTAAIAAAADRVQTGLDVIATAADRVQTGLDVIATAADRVQTGLDVIATDADATATAADRVQTGLDVIATALSEAAALNYVTEVKTARDQAIAIVYGGAYSINAAAGNVAIADTDAKLGMDWLHVGTKPEQIPVNGLLGAMAYQSPESVVIQPQASATPIGIGNMVFQLTSDTVLEAKVKGSDATIRGVAIGLNQTVNCVGYFNSAGVLTSGAGLQFDGANLGLGVTPSAWATNYLALDVGTVASFFAAPVSGYHAALTGNAYTSATQTLYKINGPAERFALLSAGGFRWETAPSGTAGAAITFTEKARIDSDGLKFNGDTAAANALDDAERGTWTTTFSGLTNLTGTAALAKATYTKVGRLTHLEAEITGLSVTTTGVQASLTFTTPIAMSAIDSRALGQVYMPTNVVNYGVVVPATNVNAVDLALIVNAVNMQGASGATTITISITYNAA